MANTTKSGATGSSAGQFGAETKHKAQEAATAVADKTKDAADRAKDAAGTVADRAKDMASNMADKAKDAADRAKDAASHAVDRAQEAASNLGHKAQETAANLGHKAEDAKSSVGGQMKSLAGNIRERAPHDGMTGRAAEAVASGLESSGRYLQENSFGDMGQDMADLVRRYPLQAILLGIGVGFLIARATRS